MIKNIKKGFAAILMAATLLFLAQGCFFGDGHGGRGGWGHGGGHRYYHHR
jgi:hypothetical protein